MTEKTRLTFHLAWAMLGYIVLLSSPSRAGDPLHHLFDRCVPDCIGKWCPDDYCSKREPCTNVPLCFGCDDYCSKKAPCVCAPLNFCCDDYCKKCPPKVCSGPLCQYLKCGPSCPPCRCAICAKTASNSKLAQSFAPKEPLQTDADDPSAHGQSQQPPAPFAPVIVRVSDFMSTN